MSTQNELRSTAATLLILAALGSGVAQKDGSPPATPLGRS